MKENYRQIYLSHLGIENYMPRWALPGAPPSVLCAWEIQPDTVSEGETLAEKHEDLYAEPVEQDTKPASRVEAPIADVLGDLALSAKQTSKKADKNKLSAEEILSKRDKVVEAARYTLTLWQVSPSLIILDSRQSELALPTEQLLQNILRTVGHTVKLPRAELLRWPLVDTKAVAAGVTEAREHLAALLSAKLTANNTASAPSLWIMGAAAADYSLPEIAEYETLQGKHVAIKHEWIDDLEITAYVMPSLVDMLQKPSAKRVTWQSLQQWLQARKALVND